MEPENKTNGALIGAIVILIILIIGGVYLFKNAKVPAPTPSAESDAQEILDPQADATSSTEMEAELESVDLESLDSEI